MRVISNVVFLFQCSRSTGKEKPHLRLPSSMRCMSDPYIAVEKVTESVWATVNVKWSFGLAAYDKRIEGVACPRDSSHIPSYVQQELRPLLFIPCRGLFFIMSSLSTYSRHHIWPRVYRMFGPSWSSRSPYRRLSNTQQLCRKFWLQLVHTRLSDLWTVSQSV